MISNRTEKIIIERFIRNSKEYKDIILTKSTVENSIVDFSFSCLTEAERKFVTNPKNRDRIAYYRDHYYFLDIVPDTLRDINYRLKELSSIMTCNFKKLSVYPDINIRPFFYIVPTEAVTFTIEMIKDKLEPYIKRTTDDLIKLDKKLVGLFNVLNDSRINLSDIKEYYKELWED